jgi:rubrerythrin
MVVVKPYTYLIGWSEHKMFYYGVRYAKNCHPDDLWKTYFTSSKYVKEFRKEHGEPDIIQIRKTFKDKRSAIDWEDKVLSRRKYYLREDFLNKNRAKGFDIPPEITARVNACPERAKKISKAITGQKRTAEQRKNISIARKKWGARKQSEEERRKRSEKQLKNNVGFSVKWTCPKCGLHAQKANIARSHGLDGSKCKW